LLLFSHMLQPQASRMEACQPEGAVRNGLDPDDILHQRVLTGRIRLATLLSLFTWPLHPSLNSLSFFSFLFCCRRSDWNEQPITQAKNDIPGHHLRSPPWLLPSRRQSSAPVTRAYPRGSSIEGSRYAVKPWLVITRGLIQAVPCWKRLFLSVSLGLVLAQALHPTTLVYARAGVPWPSDNLKQDHSSTQ
jgi:hypothetical protein